MHGEARKEVLIEATMDIVAELGLSNFAMKKVTDKVGCSEMLLYKYFGTKENLLYTCFEKTHTEIGQLFSNMGPAMHCKNKEELYSTIRLCWMMYFNYLVTHGNATVFYFTYRDSAYIREVYKHDDEARMTYFKGFVDFFNALNDELHIYDKVKAGHLWTYILDTSGIFAKRVIRGELENTPESTEKIWQLI